MAGVVDERSDGRALFERIPKGNGAEHVICVEWQQSEAVKLFADAFAEAKCSYDSERASAPGCVSKCLKVGDGVFSAAATSTTRRSSVSSTSGRSGE